ncbi:MAG: branched-chain amino acid transport system substrate-binding protein [Thermotogaceae bacterium]|nr:branched-chain amino acid transport system substrate-binding protein [Thermotogaceae bacterium]
MMSRKNILLVVLILILFVSLLSAQIKLAAILPITGASSAFGQQGKQGLLLAMEMYPTVLGKKVEIVFIDTKSEKVEAANAFTRAIDYEKVVAIIGEISSSNTLAGSAIAEKKKVPTITPTATNPLVTQGKRYVFRVCFIDPFQGFIAAKFAHEDLKAKKVAIFTDIEQDFCVGLASFFKKNFTSFGGEIFEEYYRTGDQDFSAQLTDALSKNPDLLYVPGYYTEVALIARQARQFGYYGPILSADGCEAQQLINIGGDAVENLYYTTHYHPDAAQTDIAEVFVQRFEEKFNERPSALSALIFDAYLMILKAIETANSTDPEDIANALRNIKNFKGVTGIINMGEDGNPVKTGIINMVKDGKFTFVKAINP